MEGKSRNLMPTANGVEDCKSLQCASFTKNWKSNSCSPPAAILLFGYHGEIKQQHQVAASLILYMHPKIQFSS